MLEVLTRINLPVLIMPWHLLAQWQYVEGANHHRKKRNFGTVLYSFTKIHYFTFLSFTDLNILHLYKDPSYMLLSEVIKVLEKGL